MLLNHKNKFNHWFWCNPLVLILFTDLVEFISIQISCCLAIGDSLDSKVPIWLMCQWSSFIRKQHVSLLRSRRSRPCSDFPWRNGNCQPASSGNTGLRRNGGPKAPHGVSGANKFGLINPGYLHSYNFQPMPYLIITRWLSQSPLSDEITLVQMVCPSHSVQDDSNPISDSRFNYQACQSYGSCGSRWDWQHQPDISCEPPETLHM